MLNNSFRGFNIGEKFFGGSNPLASPEGIGSLVTLFLRGAFVLAGIAILFFFIMAGIDMIAGAGSNDPQKMEQAKKTATSALIGFVIVFASYWIVKLVGQIIGISDLI